MHWLIRPIWHEWCVFKQSKPGFTYTCGCTLYISHWEPQQKGKQSISLAWLGRKVETIVKVTSYLKLLPCRVWDTERTYISVRNYFNDWKFDSAKVIVERPLVFQTDTSVFVTIKRASVKCFFKSPLLITGPDNTDTMTWPFGVRINRVPQFEKFRPPTVKVKRGFTCHFLSVNPG